jgi:uncharacterized membrane protein YfcA
MEHITALALVVYGLVSFVTAIVSGIAGGGAGFINTPLLILLGLSPAQAIATGKLSGLAVATSSLTGLQSVPIRSKKLVAGIMAMALVIGLVAPLIITNLNSELYQRLLGVLLLAMLPVMFFSKIGRTSKQPSARSETVGYILLAGTLFLQAIFSAGMGTLVNIVLMACLGMSALEANVTKRYSQVVLNTVIVLGVLVVAADTIVWPVALVGIVSAAAGGFIGGKLAIKKGDKFVLVVFSGLIFVSAIALLVG